MVIAILILIWFPGDGWSVSYYHICLLFQYILIYFYFLLLQDLFLSGSDFQLLFSGAAEDLSVTSYVSVGDKDMYRFKHFST